MDKEIKKGDRVSLNVEWPNGRVINMIGTLVCVRDGEAYVETSQGPVVGSAESLEKEPNDDVEGEAGEGAGPQA